MIGIRSFNYTVPH